MENISESMLNTNDSELEAVDCPLCSSNYKSTCYQFKPFSVVRCKQCGFHYLSPRLKKAAMEAFYRNDSYFKGDAVGYSNYNEQEGALRATFRRLMGNLEKRAITGGSLLEIGCGYGYLLDEARPYFDTRIGTELSSLAAEKAQANADHVYTGTIDNIPLGMSFDCIIATHVIEHVYDPKEFIKRLYSHLKPNGRVIIAAPNMRSPLRYIMGHHWPSFKIPEHILYFDKKSLTFLMKEAGLEGVNSLPYPHGFPLSLIASKFNLRLPTWIGRVYVWIYTTTVAAYGVRYDK